ncbi:MAG: hypothetical protein PVI26_00135, partial [Chitinispirillia bacterium]
MNPKLSIISYFSIIFTFLVLFQCANYKQLKPKPELSFLEQGYIEIKNNKKNFELKKEKKYFITFPAPQDNNFYLVLEIHDKHRFETSLTPDLLKKKKPGKKILDESTDKKNLSVYAIDKSVPMYYWLIENVKQDVVARIKYRYVPQWRFRFENKYTEFQGILKNNRVDRQNYINLGTSFHFNKFTFPIAIDSVSKHKNNLDALLRELLLIESIFPQSIINSTDKAYLNYKKLKSKLEDEIKFQTNYLAVLDFFHKENQTRGNPSGFLDHVQPFIEYFSLIKKFPANVINESKNVLERRLREVVPFYDQRLGGKDDALPVDRKLYRLDDFNKVNNLYQEAGIATPKEYTVLSKFINGFDTKSNQLYSAYNNLDSIINTVKDYENMPDNDFFSGLITKLNNIQQQLPQPIGEDFGKYFHYNCTRKLNMEISQLESTLTKTIKLYREADQIVPQLNVFRSQKDYRSMLGILKTKRHLPFLLDKYHRLDRMSVDKQVNTIREALQENQWSLAESGLRKLHQDNNFLNLSAILPVKRQAVEELEDSLYIRIDRVSRFRINKFLEENINTLKDVDSLYTNSVFLPAHNVTFSTGSKAELIQRKNDLVAHLAKIKENEFPFKAIKTLYNQFIKNPNQNGVLMARAIVTHGNHYKGNDKKTKIRIDECNPWSAKWIVK